MNALYDISAENLISAGNFSSVYKVSANGRVCALKVTNVGFGAKMDREKAYSEVKLLLQFQCEFIVKCYKFEEIDEVFYAELEFCQTDLDTVITSLAEKRDYLKMKNALKCSLHIANGLEYLFHQKVIHRDIKPANILVTSDGVSKITDFNLAVQLNDANQKIRGCAGTAGFIAPEVYNGLYGIEFDVFSLGAVIYMILLSDKPYETSPVRQQMFQILSSGYKAFPKFSINHFGGNVIEMEYFYKLKNIVEKCLVDDPDQRCKIFDIAKEINNYYDEFQLEATKKS